ncbi:MAG: tetratricopeptide repeat protein [Acidobacteria bacterium]|nr:tetratricopeptide repeat protein [Acidobacteriota bacterium]
MMKIKLLTACALIFLTGCFKTPSTNTSRTSTNDRQTSPTAEKTDPKSKSDDFGKAVSDFNGKYYDQALAGFQKVLETEPDNADALFFIGQIYYIRQDWNTSLGYFEKAAKIDFKSPEKLMALAENQRGLKQYDRAIVQYQKVQGFQPKNAAAYYGAGLTYVGLNNKIAARQQLQILQPLDKSLADKLAKEIDGMK